MSRILLLVPNDVPSLALTNLMFSCPFLAPHSTVYTNLQEDSPALAIIEEIRKSKKFLRKDIRELVLLSKNNYLEQLLSAFNDNVLCKLMAVRYHSAKSKLEQDRISNYIIDYAKTNRIMLWTQTVDPPLKPYQNRKEQYAKENKQRSKRSSSTTR